MKTLYAIEVKTEKNSKNSMIIFQCSGCLAVYEFKKVAKDKLDEIYEEFKNRMLKDGVKPYPKNRFIIKEYICKE
jgi:hypothetical protein